MLLLALFFITFQAAKSAPSPVLAYISASPIHTLSAIALNNASLVGADGLLVLQSYNGQSRPHMITCMHACIRA